MPDQTYLYHILNNYEKRRGNSLALPLMDELSWVEANVADPHIS